MFFVLIFFVYSKKNCTFACDFGQKTKNDPTLFIHLNTFIIMNKTELAAKAGVKKEVVDAVLNAIVEAVKAGETVSVIGFGTFGVVERAAHKGINPLTKQAIEIPAKKAVKFKAGSKFAF